jgi:hypothetical protein
MTDVGARARARGTARCETRNSCGRYRGTWRKSQCAVKMIQRLPFIQVLDEDIRVNRREALLMCVHVCVRACACECACVRLRVRCAVCVRVWECVLPGGGHRAPFLMMSRVLASLPAGDDDRA